MIRFAALAVVACTALACESSSGGGSTNDLGVASGAATAEPTPPRPGFADDIARQITGETPQPEGSAAPPDKGSAEPTGSAAPVKAGSAGPMPAGSGAKVAGSAAPAAGSAAPRVVAPAGSATPGPTKHRGAMAAMKLSPQAPSELAKIKLSLGPNWQRDSEGPGTLSFALTDPAKGQSVLFVFEYGYELDSAPVDREAYKQWLADTKVLTNIVDRQRGVSWYLEGTDAGGKPAFRSVAQFGPKKLICGGSLYRDAESSKFGDLRDEIVLRAKQICETVAL